MANSISPYIKRSVFGLAILVASFCTSCDESVVVNAYTSIPDRLWSYEHKPTFQADIQDNKVPYDLRLNLRVTSDYPYQDIFVIIKETTPKKITSSSRVHLKLTTTGGQWLGKGNGTIYSYQSSFLKNHPFSDTGIYRYTIEQNMQENPLKGVSDIGLYIGRSKK